MKSKFVYSCLLVLLPLFLTQISMADTFFDQGNDVSPDSDAFSLRGRTRPLATVLIPDKNAGELGTSFPLVRQFPAAATLDWRSEAIDHPRLGQIKSSRSFRLDPNNHPHIVYVGEEGLFYAWYNGTNWQHITVEDSTGGDDPSLVLDNTNHPPLATCKMAL